MKKLNYINKKEPESLRGVHLSTNIQNKPEGHSKNIAKLLI